MSVTENTKDIGTLPLPQTLLDIRHLSTVLRDMTESEKHDILQLIEKYIKNEKRRRQRRNQFIKAEVEYKEYAENGIIQNLSPGGAFLTTRHFHPLGSEISLSFAILNFEFPVKLKAEVIWRSPKGMGLKFKSSQKLDERLAAQKLADALEPMPTES